MSQPNETSGSRHSSAHSGADHESVELAGINGGNGHYQMDDLRKALKRLRRIRVPRRV